MFDDERDFGQYFEQKHKEEQLILTWQCRRSNVSTFYDSDAEGR